MRVVGIVFEGWCVFFCLARCYPFLLSPWWDPLVYPCIPLGLPWVASFDEYILLLLKKKFIFYKEKSIF